MLLEDGGPNCIRFGENGDQSWLHHTSYFGLDILPRFEVRTTHRQECSSSSSSSSSSTNFIATQVLQKLQGSVIEDGAQVAHFSTFTPQVKLWEEGSYVNDCRSLLQPVEDTLSIALTNVLVLHVHYHTYVFCCRNTELGQLK